MDTELQMQLIGCIKEIDKQRERERLSLLIIQGFYSKVKFALEDTEARLKELDKG